MTPPANHLRAEVAVVTAAGEFEVVLSVTDGTLPLAALLEELGGQSGGHALVDGFPVAADTPLAEVPFANGSRIELVGAATPDPAGALVALTGRDAGEVRYLPPGVHRLGPVDVGVQVRGAQGGAACLYVDVDGTGRIDPGSTEMTPGGASGSGTMPLGPGDELWIDGTRYRFTAIGAPPRNQGRVAFNRPPRSEFPADLPLLVAPGAPPAPQQPTRFGWGALIVPIVIGAAMALLWNPMMALFAVFSPAMLLANYFEDKRRTRRTNEAAGAGLAAAVDEFRQRVAALERAARVLAWRTTPSPQQLIARLVAGDARLWQRRPDHADFLELGVGVGNLPWSPEVTPSAADRAPAANQVLAAVAELRHVPIAVSLRDGVVLGIAGERRRQIELARWVLIQAAAHHGPSDLPFYIVTDHPTEWDFAKWLPHLRGDGDGTRLAVASPGEEADRLLAPLLDATAGTGIAGTAESGPVTLVVVDIDDLTAPAAESARRVLAGEGDRRRSGIALAGSVAELPSSCSAIARLNPHGGAMISRPSRATELGPFPAWRLGGGSARRLARRIGRYADPDQRVGGADLPDVVHLLDLLGLGAPRADAIARRWAAAGPSLRCAAPIGTTADGPLWVDWASDGPHGLMAGTTGSGKSELLRTLVAGLAVSVDPEHLNFVLIDYKGGSAFDACAALPHTVGLVTDLDGHLAQRALTCLEAELRYREEILRAEGATDIDEYQTRRGRAPLPRLLVVIDEFAALVKELPDFVTALVDVAQRGRSLGVHLLLATQRPSGVVNDAIRANTNLRLSLRVQDAADSTDVIGTAVAAQLPRTRPGRGYLRRGPGDTVGFQSALVTGRAGTVGAAVRVEPFELVPGEGGPAPPHPAGAAAPTDLELVVAAVREAARLAGMAPPRLPWPEPLPAAISLAQLEDGPEAPDGSPTGVAIGWADEPHRQRRIPFVWSVIENLLIYGVQGAGSSTALRAAVLAACRAFPPDTLHAYVLDFDDQTHGALETVPHVGAVIGAGERARQQRLLRYLQREVAARREEAGTDPAARRARPRIVVALDSYGGLRAAYDDPADLPTKEAVARIVAEGPGVGVVVVATAKQPTDVPAQVAALIPDKLIMRLADQYDYTGLGVTLRALPDIPGRAFEAGTSREVQLAAVTAADIAESSGDPPAAAGPWAIELLPAEVKIPDILAPAEVYDLEWTVPIGIGDDRLLPVGWTLREGDHVLIAGPVRSGKSTALATIATVLRRARPDSQIIALAPRRSALAECPEVDVLLSDAAGLTAVAGCGEPTRPQVVLIDDAEDVADADGTIAALVAERHPHRHVFAAGSGDMLRAAYGHWTQAVRRSRLGLALRPDSVGDGDLWQATLPRRVPDRLPVGRGYLITARGVELVQVAWQ